jgi:F-type H+-transporting ATPase subunit gamma
MPSLKDLRNRITSVKATQKITKAMQMVAAAKLRRAQMAAEAARPFALRMDSVLANLASGVNGDGAPRLLAGTGSDKVHLLLVCTAERGLCGAFNSSIARLARDKAIALKADGKTVKIICVGKKGYDVLRRMFEKDIIELVDLRSFKQVGYVNAEAVAKGVLAQRIIPAEIPAGAVTTGSVYDYEPGEGEILESLLPRNLTVQILRALLENGASEQGARMSAMDSATRNAGEMIKKQTQIYNRSRQAMITKELIEIISGAEAL